MAYTATKSDSTVLGNQRVWQGVVSADAASGVVSFGLGNLAHVSWAPKSMNSANIKVRINAVAAGTASAGDVGISGCTSGDEFYLIVYGR